MGISVRSGLWTGEWCGIDGRSTLIRFSIGIGMDCIFLIGYHTWFWHLGG